MCVCVCVCVCVQTPVHNLFTFFLSIQNVKKNIETEALNFDISIFKILKLKRTYANY